jgi:DNA-binding protein HU-beta
MGSLEGKTVNKSQLIDALAARYEGNRKQAAHALDSVLDTITREVAKGEKVAITGFGSFEKAVRNARWVRNPQTGERMKSKKKAVPKFSPGQDLKNIVSGAKKLPKLTAATMPKPPSVRSVATAATATAAAATKRGSASKSAASKTASKSTPAKKSAAKSTPSKSTASKSTAAKKAAAKKTTPAKKSTTKSTASKSAPAKKSASTSTAATKAPAKKASTTKKAAAKKS